MAEQIQQLVDRIGADLQALEDQLKIERVRRVKIRFPRGYLRTAKEFRKRYWFISDSTLQRNIAYCLILNDVYRWLLNRTDLWGTAREMIIKEGVCLIGNLCESITKDAAQNICSKKASFKQRTAAMVKAGMISQNLKTALDRLWDWRNRQHLFLLRECEYGKYTSKEYNSSLNTLRRLRRSLHKFFRKQETPSDATPKIKGIRKTAV